MTENVIGRARNGPQLSVKTGGHGCKLPASADYCNWEHAIEECWEASDGTLWATGGEYGSQVNYCPVCGYRAERQIDPYVEGGPVAEPAERFVTDDHVQGAGRGILKGYS
jgi:hypothetical protein